MQTCKFYTIFPSVLGGDYKHEKMRQETGTEGSNKLSPGKSKDSTLEDLLHPGKCPLCDQADKDVQHLLTTCVFAWEFWHKILQPLDLQRCVPGRHEILFAEW
jgi:hypothetical protein